MLRVAAIFMLCEKLWTVCACLILWKKLPDTWLMSNIKKYYYNHIWKHYLLHLDRNDNQRDVGHTQLIPFHILNIWSLKAYLNDNYYVYCFQMSHAHAADLDDKTFNAKWEMLAKVREWES